jgi:hypothetical protein
LSYGCSAERKLGSPDAEDKRGTNFENFFMKKYATVASDKA